MKTDHNIMFALIFEKHTFFKIIKVQCKRCPYQNRCEINDIGIIQRQTQNLVFAILVNRFGLCLQSLELAYCIIYGNA